jgi:hypothetical protein
MLMFDCMNYTGAQVNVTIAREMCPPERELTGLPAAWKVTKPPDSSGLHIELSGEAMDTTESPQPACAFDAPGVLHLQNAEVGMEIDCKVKIQARHHGAGKEHYVVINSTADSLHKASGKIYKGKDRTELKSLLRR